MATGVEQDRRIFARPYKLTMSRRAKGGCDGCDQTVDGEIWWEMTACRVVSSCTFEIPWSLDARNNSQNRTIDSLLARFFFLHAKPISCHVMDSTTIILFYSTHHHHQTVAGSCCRCVHCTADRDRASLSLPHSAWLLVTSSLASFHRLSEMHVLLFVLAPRLSPFRPGLHHPVAAAQSLNHMHRLVCLPRSSCEQSVRMGLR